MSAELEDNLPYYSIDVSMNEDTLERTFICPVSGENVFSWDFENHKFPEELCLIHFQQGEEPIYVSPAFEKEYAEWVDGEDESRHGCYGSFMDYLVSILPKDEPFYCLELVDPDFPAGGENTYMIYRGVYADA
jgi:hypothetical protein